MTPTNVPKLSVRSIADLISVVPYLLGFHPTDSIVVIAFNDRKLVFAARVDLPPVGAPPADRRAAATHLSAVVGNQDAETVTIIGYGPADRVTPAVDAVSVALAGAGLGVIDVLRVTDGRYWSYTCDNPECCPAEGIAFEPATTQIAAAATVAGQVALPDREALQRQVAPVDGRVRESMRRATDRAGERLAALLDAAPPDDPLGRRVLQRVGAVVVREAMDRHRDGGWLTDDEVAWLSLLLAHIPVRDYAWERIGTEEWHLALWTDVLRRAESEMAAAPACLLAFAAWRGGQGSLASVAVERALHAAPDYSMALLMQEVLCNGIAPSKLDDWPTMGRIRPGPAMRRTSRGRRGKRRRAQPTRRSPV